MRIKWQEKGPPAVHIVHLQMMQAWDLFWSKVGAGAEAQVADADVAREVLGVSGWEKEAIRIADAFKTNHRDAFLWQTKREKGIEMHWDDWGDKWGKRRGDSQAKAVFVINPCDHDPKFLKLSFGQNAGFLFVSHFKDRICMKSFYIWSEIYESFF